MKQIHYKMCTSCKAVIYFKINGRGKFVPFNAGTEICHFETCIDKKNPDSFKGVVKSYSDYNVKDREKLHSENKSLSDF